MISLAVLGSGSRGNCACVWTEETAVLIDAGLGTTTVEKRLRALGKRLRSIQGIVLTHEHGDHVKHTEALAKKCNCPVYMTVGTHHSGKVGKLRRVETFDSGDDLKIGQFDIETAPISHDAEEPVAFAFKAFGLKVFFAYDLGEITLHVVDLAHEADIVAIESNHDLGLLEASEYPEFVKNRARGKSGHLSNEQAAEFLRGNAQFAQAVVLTHLSQQTNTAELARVVAQGALRKAGLDARIVTTSQTKETEAISL